MRVRCRFFVLLRFAERVDKWSNILTHLICSLAIQETRPTLRSQETFSDPKRARNPNPTSVDQTFNLFGVLINSLVTPSETGHEVSLFKGTLPLGVVIPLHSHAEPEVFYGLEGSLEVYRESGQSQGWSATQPGGVRAIPGKVKHALRNASSTPTTVILVT